MRELRCLSTSVDCPLPHPPMNGHPTGNSACFHTRNSLCSLHRLNIMNTTTTKQAWIVPQQGTLDCPIVDRKPRFDRATPIEIVAEATQGSNRIVFFICEGQYYSWETAENSTRYHSVHTFNGRMYMFGLPRYSPE